MSDTLESQKLGPELNAASCHSPVNVSRDFASEADTYARIRALTKKSSSLQHLRYKRSSGLTAGPGARLSFYGVVSDKEREQSYQVKPSMEVACGFLDAPLSGFSISDEDRAAMNACTGLVVLSVVTDGYDDITQPKNLLPTTLNTLSFFFFTDEKTLEVQRDRGTVPVNGKIGVWRIILVKDLPYPSGSYLTSAMNGVIVKHLPHRLFPNAAASFYLDGKMQLLADPAQIFEWAILRKGHNLAISQHPINIDTLEELRLTLACNRMPPAVGWSQFNDYMEDGFQPYSSFKPHPSDVPDSAVIMREHSPLTNLHSCLWFGELNRYNVRDQLSFAYVRDKITEKLNVHMFDSCNKDIFVRQCNHTNRSPPS